MTTPNDAVRQRILDEARSRFLTDGFAHFSLNRLCRELSMAKKTFYKNFDDKNALLDALVVDSARAYARTMAEGAAVEGEEARLRARARGLFTLSAKHFSTAFLSDLQELRPDLYERISRARRRLLNHLLRDVQAGQESGTLREDLDPRAVTRLLVLMVDRALDPNALAGAKLEPHEAAALMFDLVLDGLRAR